jgi:hypothetical protein
MIKRSYYYNMIEVNFFFFKKKKNHSVFTQTSKQSI